MLVLGAMAMIFTSSMKESEESNYSEELAALGQETLLNGGQLTADSLNGRMLLVSFWASYDPSSRINSYNLLKIQDEYKTSSFDGGEGLEVVCVSLDVFRSPLVKAIESDGTQSFYHICDLKGEESPLAKSFDVNRPVNLLISADGRILARDFGTQTIAETLSFLKIEE